MKESQMTMRNHVTSIELSRRLKELGVPQKSLFYWRAWENPISGIVSESTCPKDRWVIYYHEDKHSKSCDWECSAYLATELGEWLPAMIAGCPLEVLKGFIFEKSEVLYCARYYDAGIIGETDINMSNSLAKMLIHLIENGIVNLEDLK